MKLLIKITLFYGSRMVRMKRELRSKRVNNTVIVSPMDVPGFFLINTSLRLS